MNWLNWLCIDFVIEWLLVQTLLRTNLTFFFAKISFGMEMKRQKTLAAKGGSLVGWETTNNGL